MTRIWAKLTLFTVAVFLLIGSVGFAAGFGGEKDWRIPILGVLRVPNELRTAEFPDIKEIIDSQKDKLASQPELPIADAKETLDPKKLDPNRAEFAAYQLTMNDGQAIHLAWLIVVRDRIALDPQTRMYFDKPLNIEQRVTALMMQEKLSQNIDAMQYQDAPTGIGFKVLEIDQFDLGNIAGKQAYAGGVRFLINYKDFLFPFYTRCWIFSAGGYGAGVMLVTTDSERVFWSPVFNSIMPTLRPMPPVKSAK